MVLFSDDATYRETPFDEIMTGREAIRTYWQEIPETQEDVSFGWDIVHAEPEPATVRWWSSYIRKRDRKRVRLDGVFLLEFDPDSGLCRSLREWWHADEGPAF